MDLFRGKATSLPGAGNPRWNQPGSELLPFAADMRLWGAGWKSFFRTGRGPPRRKSIGGRAVSPKPDRRLRGKR